MLFSSLLLAAVATWIPVDPHNAIVIDSTRGRIVVALEPRLAPHAVARVKQLARMHVYDGLKMWRVLDTPAEAFIQTGDPGNVDGGRSSLPDLKAEFTANLSLGDVEFVREGLDPEGVLDFVPVATQVVDPHASTVRGWGAYCSGTVGMGREKSVDSANAEIFLMRGTTRWFDHDYTVVGRVLSGMRAVRSAAVGVPPAHPDVMTKVRVLSDLPAADRPLLEYLNPRSSAFAALVAQTRARRGADFSVCDLALPVRLAPL
ncbi:MAG TPA: peptidylprolyl isomerase [Candidatus Aquilonibacter sp.]|nr:peptidylprolyl isomerase [Candidatus Aquilonibacter sp.]